MTKHFDGSLVRELFQGRASAFAEQQNDGSYKPVRRPMTDADWQDHLACKNTYGFYVAREDDRVRLCCFDVDFAGGDAHGVALEVITRVQAAGVRPNAVIEEYSGNKGVHVWVFFSEWQPSGVVSRWMREVLAPLTLPDGCHIDLFPAGAMSGEYGRLVKYPYALHLKSGKQSFILGNLEDVQPLHWRETEILFAEAVVEPVEAAPYTGDGDLLPCAVFIRKNGAESGNRNNMMYSLALASRRAGLEKDQTLSVCEEANQRFSPPLPRHEVTIAVKSAYYRNSTSFDCAARHLHEGVVPACYSGCPRYNTSYGPARSPGVAAEEA